MQVLFNGFLKLFQDTVTLKKGGTAFREVLQPKDAVAVLGFVPSLNQYVFVKQYRAPMKREMLEIIAGCVEDGEDPLLAAKREVKEETGRDVEDFWELGKINTSPGYTTETIHLYGAYLSSFVAEQELDKDEEVEIVMLTALEIEQMIKSNELTDAKTIIAWLKNGMI